MQANQAMAVMLPNLRPALYDPVAKVREAMAQLLERVSMLRTLQWWKVVPAVELMGMLANDSSKAACTVQRLLFSQLVRPDPDLNLEVRFGLMLLQTALWETALCTGRSCRGLRCTSQDSSLRVAQPALSMWQLLHSCSCTRTLAKVCTKSFVDALCLLLPQCIGTLAKHCTTSFVDALCLVFLQCVGIKKQSHAASLQACTNLLQLMRENAASGVKFCSMLVDALHSDQAVLDAAGILQLCQVLRKYLLDCSINKKAKRKAGALAEGDAAQDGAAEAGGGAESVLCLALHLH